MNKDLQGHLAVITGASSGLGEEYARQLARRGADLIIAARRLERLEALANELESSFGVRVVVIKSDLSASGAAQVLFDAATSHAAKLGRHVTMLINNAGIGPFAPFVTSTMAKHTETIQLNVVALMELSHLFGRHMLAHKQRGYIANVASLASYQGCPNFSVYAATKSFVRIFSEILNFEFKGTNVSVCCVCPGGASTEFSSANGQVLTESAHRFMMTSEEVVSVGIGAMLAGRTAVVPGFMNKFAAFLPRILPSSWALRLAHLAMSKNAKPKEKLKS